MIHYLTGYLQSDYIAGYLLFYIFATLFNEYSIYMKIPGDCESIDEIRAAIDEIDQEIIRLLGSRYKYVKEIVRFKEPNEKSIIAQERFNKVISSRKAMAEKEGLDPEVIEKIYRDLLNHFISQEMKMIRTK
jgi:isochorismate pyruvate lyase